MLFGPPGSSIELGHGNPSVFAPREIRGSGTVRQCGSRQRDGAGAPRAWARKTATATQGRAGGRARDVGCGPAPFGRRPSATTPYRRVETSRDPFLTPSGASMRSSSPEILTIPAYRNTAWRLHQRAADASKRVRSAMLVPAVLRAIGTRGAFSNEFREIHRPRPRLRPVRPVARAARRPSAVRHRASAQGAAR